MNFIQCTASRNGSIVGKGKIVAKEIDRVLDEYPLILIQAFFLGEKACEYAFCLTIVISFFPGYIRALRTAEAGQAIFVPVSPAHPFHQSIRPPSFSKPPTLRRRMPLHRTHSIPIEVACLYANPF